MIRTKHLIIGFGKAGKTLAQTLGKAGEKVILVEQSAKMYGGTCINVGCIPSKKLKFLAESGSEFHLAIQEKNELIQKLNQANYNKVESEAEVITGKASFIDSHTVKVEALDKATIVIQADYIYINTGAKNRIPDIEGIHKSQHVFDSTGIMQLAKLPEHLVIVGGGYIGLEFASMYRNFGSKVTVLESNDSFVPREDREIANALLEIMQNQGIEIKLSQKVQSFEDKGAKTIIKTSANEIEADAVLIAAGRIPNVEGLALERAGVNLTDRGFIQVNERLQTNIEHIYAMGDVAGNPQFTYISLDDFRVIRSQIFGDKTYTTEGRTFPYSVFVNPPLSVVGMTEETAKSKGYEVKVASILTSSIPKAKILENTQGILKAVVDQNTDQILGAQLLCPESHEMINFLDLAIRQGLTSKDIANYIFTHPTMSEGLNDLFKAIG